MGLKFAGVKGEGPAYTDTEHNYKLGLSVSGECEVTEASKLQGEATAQ